MSATPVPFFGLGATRSGTAWLSAILRCHPDCALASSGETHFFDVRYGYLDARSYYLSMTERLNRLARTVSKGVTAGLAGIDGGIPDEAGDDDAEADLEDDVGGVDWTDDVRSSFFQRATIDDALREMTDICARLSIVDPDSYARYLMRNSAGANAFGEVAPSYWLLPATAFAEIDSLFPNAIFIFIMRDPVQQLWSHLQGKAQIAKRRGRKRVDLNREFRRALEKPLALDLSSYQYTIRNLECVVPARRILYIFYENAISPDTGPREIRRIETALGLAHTDIDLSVCVDPEPLHPAKLNPKNLAAAKNLFSPVYRFVQKRFDVPECWNVSKASSAEADVE